MRRGARWSLHNRVNVNGGANAGVGKTHEQRRRLVPGVPECMVKNIEKSGGAEESENLTSYRHGWTM